MKLLLLVLSAAVCLGALPAAAREYAVRVVDADSGKPLRKIRIIVRYDCSATGTTFDLKTRCMFMERKTGADGIAHFPEAGSLHLIDVIYAAGARYETVGSDIPEPFAPESGTGNISLRRKSLVEVWEEFFGIE